ncbi:MAG: hypothetical protein F9K29_06605 [Hyphomicrobiaceae bacterium]|nr:MAG: hypothetical protein F9K29_06605 [Hyphomicrobiaceae bacterium]
MLARRIFSLSVGIAAACQPVAVAADEKQRLAYGEHLSRECTTCHRTDGSDSAIPTIIGWSTDEFVVTLKFYKAGERQNPTMISVAQSLDDEQMLALATYFASLKPPPKKKAQP